MRTFVAAICIATVVAAVLTPFVRLLAFRLGAVAVPGERHVHTRSTPRNGGVAIFVAFDAAQMGVFALLMTVFWIVGIVSAVNPNDGLADGAIRGRGERFPENG